jgi:predicted peptidase
MQFLATVSVLLILLTACRKNDPDGNNSRATYDSTPSPFMQKIVVELDAYHKDSAWLQLPVHYNSGFDTEKYPLLVFFNGRYEGAEYGGLKKMVTVGIPKTMADSLRFQFDVEGKNQQFIVLCPQSANGHTSPAAIDLILDYMTAKYRVDVSRIYLTGVSSGAASVLSYLTNKPEYASRIAAAVPMSSLVLEPEKTANLKFIANAGTPVKIFCGKSDGLYQDNLNYANEINRHRAGLAVFMPYNGGHGSWNSIYDISHENYNPNIYEWMLQQHN